MTLDRILGIRLPSEDVIAMLEGREGYRERKVLVRCRLPCLVDDSVEHRPLLLSVSFGTIQKEGCQQVSSPGTESGHSVAPAVAAPCNDAVMQSSGGCLSLRAETTP
jgi:hypothetical protein